MSEHEEQIEYTVGGFRAFVRLLSGIDEANFNADPGDLYWLLNPLLLDFEWYLEERNKKNSDPSIEALHQKWRQEKEELQKRQDEECRALSKITMPNMPMSPTFANDSPETFERVKSILENASRPKQHSSIERKTEEVRRRCKAAVMDAAFSKTKLEFGTEQSFEDLVEKASSIVQEVADILKAAKSVNDDKAATA